jgi:multicomponent K+:H+ antiporter subunit D
MSGFMAKTMLLQASVADAATAWIWSFVLATSFVAILALMRGGIVVFWMGRSSQGTGDAAPASLIAGAAGLVVFVMALATLAGPIKGFTDATALQMIDTQAYVRAVSAIGGRP